MDSQHPLKKMHVYPFSFFPLPELVLAAEDSFELFGRIGPLFPKEDVSYLFERKILHPRHALEDSVHREGISCLAHLVVPAGTAFLSLLQLFP
jgi:hypothetical protein